MELPFLVKTCDLFVYLNLHFRSIQFEEVISTFVPNIHQFPVSKTLCIGVPLGPEYKPTARADGTYGVTWVRVLLAPEIRPGGGHVGSSVALLRFRFGNVSWRNKSWS